MSSAYYKSLSGEDQRRYLQKLNYSGVLQLPDPYDLRNGSVFQVNDKLLPNISWPEVYTYLIDTPGIYTREKLKSYKSLEAYNYFINGKVRNVKVCKPENVPVRMVTALVNPGQKESKPYNVWVTGEENGCIVAAHCDCMAG